MMEAQLPLFPEQASTVAGRVDGVFFFILAVTVVFTALIFVLVIGFAIKYRKRPENPVPQPVHGDLRLELLWSGIPFVIVMIMFAWGASVYFAIARPPDDAMEVYVVGKQWMWKLQHPDGQREINELHIPVGRPVKLLLTSEDVIHSFFVPAFRVKQDAIPGRYTSMWFEATKPGKYHLFCAEYCGTEHSRMIGTVHALEPAAYQTWLSQSAEGSLALEGGKLFTKLQCITCHSANAQAAAPVLEELFGRAVQLADGRTVRVDEDYLRESIVNPNAKIVAGYQPIMPTYQGQISEEELVKVIAFIKALQRGQTPRRVEETPAPATAPPAQETPKRPTP